LKTDRVTVAQMRLAAANTSYAPRENSQRTEVCL